MDMYTLNSRKRYWFVGVSKFDKMVCFCGMSESVFIITVHRKLLEDGGELISLFSVNRLEGNGLILTIRATNPLLDGTMLQVIEICEQFVPNVKV